ncbi:hypothetical protein I3760_13G138000 [Carya illinoinensis]|nr:hypothetical protein I3760_13G138000 [Carya illinoinensis]
MICIAFLLQQSFMPCTCIQDIGGVPTMRMVSILQNNKAGQIRLYTVKGVSSSVFRFEIWVPFL